jgi:hypothetical protein
MNCIVIISMLLGVFGVAHFSDVLVLNSEHIKSMRGAHGIESVLLMFRCQSPETSSLRHHIITFTHRPHRCTSYSCLQPSVERGLMSMGQ